MSVRAKFKYNGYEATLYCSYPTLKEDGRPDYTKPVASELRTLKFSPVAGNTPENLVFWNYSPSGEIKLGTINPEAWSQFEFGKEYYVDFIPADNNG